MPGFVFALSISHFVSTVGADAGFASLIGLAILVLLYFAQARETATLRERAAVLESRAQQLESRLAAVGRGSPAPPVGPPLGQTGAPAPQPSFLQPRRISGAPLTDDQGEAVRVIDRRPSGPVAHPPAPAAHPLAPAAPAGTAGPALAAATRLIPLATPGASRDSEAVPLATPGASRDSEAVPLATPGASRDPEAVPLSQRSSEPAPAPVAAAAEGAAAAVSRPATAAGAANGRNGEGSGGWVAPPPAPAPVAAPPRVAAPSPGRAASGGGARELPPPRGRLAEDFDSPHRSLPARVVTGGLVALLVIAVVVVLIVVTSSGSSSSSSNAPATARTTNSPSGQPHAAAFNPAKVTIEVLNGTSTSGLAHRVSLQLSQAGYKTVPPATGPDQTLTTTVIAYMPGSRAAALHVASALKRGPASVQPIDLATQAVACPPGSACTAQVVVTVGADLATAA